MIATRNCSFGTLSELDLDGDCVFSEQDLGGYCDFGFPVGHLVAQEARHRTPEPRTTKLDAVIHAFDRVFDGSDIVTARLLAACRAHLELLRAGGVSLRLVALDLEANLSKAEALVATAPRECRTLASLLELERGRGLHDGNVLRDASAAMGLLWIRRSLAFQSHLYDAFLPAGGRHPREAAAEAYAEHLSPYHGWLLRRVFPTSLSRLPARAACLAAFGEVEAGAALGPEGASRIARKVRALTGALAPLLAAWKESFERLDLEDTRRA